MEPKERIKELVNEVVTGRDVKLLRDMETTFIFASDSFAVDYDKLDPIAKNMVDNQLKAAGIPLDKLRSQTKKVVKALGLALKAVKGKT